MRDRSIFWPLVMIAAGALWILIALGNIPRANLWALSQTLPYLLILLGFGLILRAYWRSAGMLVSVLVVAGAVLAVVYAPQLGWNTPPSWGWDFLNIGTDAGGGIAGSGVISTESRQVADFNAISIEYPGQITIQQGKSESLEIEAEDNLLPQLTSEVRNGTLYLENSERNWRDRVNPHEPVLIRITVVDLNEVHFPTAGKLQIEGLQTDSLGVCQRRRGRHNNGPYRRQSRFQPERCGQYRSRWQKQKPATANQRAGQLQRQRFAKPGCQRTDQRGRFRHRMGRRYPGSAHQRRRLN